MNVYPISSLLRICIKIGEEILHILEICLTTFNDVISHEETRLYQFIEKIEGRKSGSSYYIPNNSLSFVLYPDSLSMLILTLPIEIRVEYARAYTRSDISL